MYQRTMGWRVDGIVNQIVNQILRAEIRPSLSQGSRLKTQGSRLKTKELENKISYLENRPKLSNVENNLMVTRGWGEG